MQYWLVSLGLCGVLSACASLPTPAATQLVFFHPYRPGVLTQCENAHLRDTFVRDALPDPADPRKAWVVREAFDLRWAGGRIEQDAQGHDTAEPPLPRTDVCFVLLRQGQAVVSGAVVSEHSARLQAFPTLVRLNTPPDAPTRFELRPRFPGHPTDTAPSTWAVLNAP